MQNESSVPRNSEIPRLNFQQFQDCFCFTCVVFRFYSPQDTRHLAELYFAATAHNVHTGCLFCYSQLLYAVSLGQRLEVFA